MPVELVEGADDARLADYRDFRDPELRRARGLFAVEGREAVRALVSVGRFRLHSALLTRGALRDVQTLFDPSLPLYVADGPVVEAVCGVRFHQGCIVLAERPEDPDLGSLIAVGHRRLLALEDVTDPDNVGGAFRNALAFGVDAVLLSSRSADPLYRKSIRTSLGASLRVPFARAADWGAALERLGSSDYLRVALTPDPDARDIAELGPLGGKLVVVAGNEGDGLARATLDSADVCARIAMRPGVDSLNVSTSIGIALHRLLAG